MTTIRLRKDGPCVIDADDVLTPPEPDLR